MNQGSGHPGHRPWRPAFRLVPLDELSPHEEIDPDNLEEVLRVLSESDSLTEPLLVAEEGLVVLNGHHRLAALRRLGAQRAPVWVVDYRCEQVRVEPWPHTDPKLRVTKDEVLVRAREGRLFPPKSTRHHLQDALPPRVTPLEELL